MLLCHLKLQLLYESLYSKPLWGNSKATFNTRRALQLYETNTTREKDLNDARKYIKDVSFEVHLNIYFNDLHLPLDLFSEQSIQIHCGHEDVLCRCTALFWEGKTIYHFPTAGTVY